MARKKEAIGVADGFDFTPELEEELVPTAPKPVKTKKKKVTPKKTEKIDEETENESTERSYSKYYTPHPRKGKKGGNLGRGAVADEDKKIPFSISLTKSERELIKEVASADNRSAGNLIVAAVREYKRKHNL